MIEQLAHNTWFRIFDSVEDVIAEVKRVPARRKGNINPFGRERWIGRDFGKWSDVFTAARSPWPEGVEVVERMVADLDDAQLPKPTSRRRRTRFDEGNGDEVDYDRLRVGQPFWRTTRRQSTRGPQTVTIVVDVNANMKIPHRDILWRGAAAIAMTRILEAADFRVELWIIHKARNCYRVQPWQGDSHVTAVCLKRAGDPLDVATFTAAVSGWFYRSLLFGAKAVGKYKPVKTLGSPSAPWPRDLAHLFPGREPIVISGTYSYHGAVYVARAALERLAGVEPPKPVEPPAPVTPAEPPKPLTPQQLAELKARIKQWEREHTESQ